MKKWIVPGLAVVWVALLFIPLGPLPPLYRILIFNASPIALGNGFERNQTLPASPYGEVTIGWDERGVPHIFGSDEKAAAFGTGYAQARDRLFQIEMLNRAVLGTLSEVVGEKALESDQWWRRFRFGPQGKAWFERLKTTDPDLAAYFQAYSDGVNAYIAQLSASDLPFEFHLLGFRPSEFKPENMFNLIRYMDKTLCYGEDDLAFAQLPQLIEPGILALYYPLMDPYAVPIYPDFVRNDSVLAALKPLASLGSYTPTTDLGQLEVRTEEQLNLGSNNWAVTGRKSATGNAFLCNDTHLSLAIPGTWYEMHVVAGNRMMHGFSVAGSPFVISGFNNDIAWGMTNATWDLTDFYHLEIAADGSSYILDGQSIKFNEFKEEFKIKGSSTVVRTYQESYFGPMDSIGGEYLAVRWLGMMDSDEGKAFLGLQRAADMASAYSAVQHFMQPPQNFVLADRYGHAGLVTSGAAAFKPRGFRGIVEARSKEDLVPYLPTHRILNEFDPPRGWVGSANQSHVKDSISSVFSTRYSPNSRGARLAGLMSARDTIGRKYLQQMQTDAVDLEWTFLAAKMLQAVGPEYQKYLSDWHGLCDTSLVAPTLFNAFRAELFQAFAQEFGKDLPILPQSELIYHLLAERDTLPLPGNRTVATTQIFEQAWKSALAELQETLGEDPSKWTYNRYNLVTMNHITRLEPLGLPPFGANGSNRTLNVATGKPVTHGPSMRTVIELTPKGPIADVVHPTGQSGRINSRNFTDQVNAWKQGCYYRLNLPLSPEQSRFVTTIRFQR
jgi:penicillin amidase